MDHDKGLIIMDEWIKFDAPARIAVLVNKLRGAMDAVSCGVGQAEIRLVCLCIHHFSHFYFFLAWAL